MAKLDSLVVDMQLNSAALRSGLADAKGALESFGKQIAAIDEKLHSLSEAKGFEIAKELTKGLGEFVLKGAEAAAQMGILAQTAGVPVQEFSRLAYAANLSGVSTEELSATFNKLNKNLGLAGAGVPAQVALFKALGISVRDAGGNVKDAGTVMQELAGKFSSFADGASKSTIQMELLGKTGAGLNAFFANGADGLAKLGDEADRFGITVGPGAAEAAHAFEQSLTKLELAGRAVGQQAAAQLTPALKTLADQLLNSKDGSDALKSAGDLLANTLRVLASAGVIVAAIFKGVGASVGIAAAAVAQAVQGDFKGALTAYSQYQAATVEAGKDARKQLEAVWTSSTPAIEEHGKVVKKTMDSILKAVEDGKKGDGEYATALKELTKTAEGYEAKVEGFGKGPLGELEADLAKGKLSEQLNKLGADAEAMRDRIVKAFKELRAKEQELAEQKVNFGVMRTIAATDHTVAARQTAFDNTSRTTFDQRAVAQGGFASFDAALKAFADETNKNSRWLGEAQLREREGNEKGAEAALAFADQAKYAAEKAGLAADAFTAGAAQLTQEISSAVSKVASKMGQVGEVINAGIEGFKSGGLWGAIIAIIVEILTMLDGFKLIVDSMNKFFSTALGNFNKAFGPIFQVIVRFAEDIGSLIETITSVTYVFQQLQAVMWLLSKVIDSVELSFLYVGKGILSIVGAHDKQLDAMVGKIEKDFATGINFGTFDQTNTAVATLGTTTAALNDKFSELLTNLPSGYKGLAGATFGADNGTGGTGAAPGASGSDQSNSVSTSGQIGSTTQVQTSTSTRPSGGATPGSDAPSPGSQAWRSGLSDSDYQLWMSFFQVALVVMKMDQNGAIAWATQMYLNLKGGRSSSGSAATAAGSSSSSGIHQVGSGPSGISSVSGAGEIHVHGDVNFHGVTDLEGLHRKLAEIAHIKGAQNHRNGTRSR